jgi:hypothetical protein
VAADNIISARTQVDLSGLTQYKTAAENAATATQQLGVAMDTVYRASTQIAAGVAAATSNLNAFVTAANAAATAATATASQVTLLATAMANLGAQNVGGALAPVTGVMQAHANATQQVATQYSQARLAGRALVQEAGGPMSSVFGQLAAQSSVLSPILANLFPVIAFAAVVDILVTIYEKFTKVSS